MSRKHLILFGILMTCMGLTLSASIFAQDRASDTYLNEDCDICKLDACTVVIVGKGASADGSIITTHTADCGICDFSWRYVPPADHEPGAKRKIHWFSQFDTTPPSKGYHWDNLEHKFNGLEIDQVEHTFGYLHGMFGYLNDNQVAFGESTIGCKRALRNPTPAAKFDITQLTLIAMERATTARHAIQIMGDLATTFGYGNTDGGEMLAVSDPKEVWIFEIMPVGPLWNPETGKPGAVWCAQRVPDDHVSLCPNESRIGEIDLKNSDFFMASENVVSCAVEMGLYDPKSGEPFSWKKAYSPAEFSAVSSNGSRARMWRFYDLVAPSKEYSAEMPNMDFPFSVKPDKKLSVTDVFAILRDNFEGTQFDMTSGIRGGPFQNPNYAFRKTIDEKRYNLARSIGMNHSEYTTVIQVRDWLPNPVGGILWLSLGSLNTTCFVPFYQGVTRLPQSYQFGDHWEFDRRVARWAFDYADFHTQVVYSHAIEDVRAAQEKWETGAVLRTQEIDAKALTLYKKSPGKARAYLTDYCCNNARLVVDSWWKLGDDLLVKYNHFGKYDVKNRKGGRLEYPDVWIRTLIKTGDVKPLPERH